MQRIFIKTTAALSKLGSSVGGLLFIALFGCLITQIVTRLVLGQPAAWTEEIAAATFLWVIFWGAAFATPLSEHVAIDLFEARFSNRVQRATKALGLIIIAACFAWSLPGVIDYVSFMDREQTPVTQIRFSWVYAIFVAFVAMIVVRCLIGAFSPPSPVTSTKTEGS